MSRNFQSFQKKTVELTFTGSSKDEVLDWVKRFEQAGQAQGVVVIGLSQFLSEHARSNFNEQESINKASGVAWTWP